MKKTLALFLALIMLLSVGSSLAEEPKKLTVWIPVYQFGDGPSDLDFWTEQLADFSKENNVEINIEIKPWTDYYTNAYTGLLSNDGPDVVYGPTFDMMANGLLLPLDEYFTQEEKDNYIYWDLGRKDKDGKQYDVPMMVGNACVTFYNKDILAECGVTELPKTWDEFIDVCKVIKAAKPEVFPFLQNWGASTGTGVCMTSFWPYYFQAGGVILDANGDPAINNEAGLATLEFIKRLMDEGIFDETVLSMDDVVTRFTNGESAFLIAGTGKCKSFTDINWDFYLSLEGPGGMGTLVPSEGMGVNAKTKYPELAVGVVKVMTGAKAMDAFHTNVYAMPKITKDSSFQDNPAFEALYTEDADKLFQLSSFEGIGSFEETLRGNIQLMLMGEMTPQEVLDETTTYYFEQIKQ